MERKAKEKITAKNKQDAEDYFNKLTKGFNGKDMLSAVNSHSEKVGMTGVVWKKEFYKGEFKKGGLNKQTYYRNVTMLKSIRDAEVGTSLDNINSYLVDPISSVEKGFSKVMISMKLAKEFLKVPIPEEDLSNSLSNTKWAAYFSFYHNEGSNRINEGIIGRAIVDITGHSGEENTVEFTNTQLAQVQNYKGSYISHMDMDRGYVSFNLNTSASNPKKGRNIHIKVYCEGRDQELLLGQYTTYEKARIQSGRIIFLNFKKINKDKGKEAGAFSHFLEGCEDFNHEHIPSGCLKFLSVRSDSYKNDIFSTGGARVNTIDELEKRLFRRRELDNSKFERFIERVKPKVFLASAGTNKEVTSVFPQIKKSIDQKFDGNLYVSYKIGKLGDEDKDTRRFEERKDDEGFLQPFRDIEKLKRTRFFILFLGEDMSKLSYSYLQLGIALTVSKVIVLVGKRSQISTTIAEMRDSVIEKIFLEDEFDYSEDYQFLIKQIHHILAQNLPDKLKGKFKVDVDYKK